MLKSLGHPLRLRIVAQLCHGEEHVTALAEIFQVGQAIISQQLRILRMNGLVDVSRQGGRAVYRIAEEQLHKMVHCIEGCSLL